MAEKQLYFLAGYDDATEAKLAGLQQSLYDCGFEGTQTRSIPMHITMGIAPSETEEEQKRFLKELCAETEAFDVSFNHAGIFSGGRVLFIAPDCSMELLALRERFGSSFSWTPHTTMLIDEPDIIKHAVPKLLEGFSSFCGRVTHVHLYEFFPARHILTLPLKNDA